MSKRPLIILLLFVFLLAACNNEPIEEEPITRPTPTTETAAPTQAPADDGYPADPQPTEPAAAYPAAGEGEGETLTEGWIVLPAGTQCEENLAYPTTDSAVEELENAGITPLAVEETELVVCEACGCPTSAHYRILVSAEDMAIAISLGWQPEG
jgi:hypothetical protein